MLIVGVLGFLFGAAAAVDLIGCRGKPKVIDGLRPLTGEVTSPGYKEGEVYPTDLMCQYTITAPYGFRIKLSFAEMDLEESDMCMADAVEIVEHGNPPRGLGVFCGNQTYPPLISATNVVSILFRSNFLVGHRGFRIQYQVSGRPAVCDHLGQMPCKNRHCYDVLDRCNGVDNCGDGTDEEGCDFPLKAGDCGLRNTSGFHGYDRIIGGKEAEPGSWPWQADLQVAFFHPNGHACGGTLINSQWILTAAHCFEQFRVPLAWRVHLGNHHKFKKDKSEQVRMVERIILYPGTTGVELMQLPMIDVTNDLALMKLNAPVKFTDQVRPACLPTQGYEIPVGTKCMASGWGITRDFSPNRQMRFRNTDQVRPACLPTQGYEIPVGTKCMASGWGITRGTGSNNVLKEVDLTIQPDHVCNSTLTGPMNPDTMICVKNERGFQDVCHGDSGGPLVCEIDKKWHVMGATSFGTDGNLEGGLCALPGSATVYSKAAHKAKWIHEQINKYS